MKKAMVYFVRAGADGPIKIGHAKSPHKRLGSLQVGSPEPLTILGVLPGGGELEAELHARFEDAKRRGEWFDPVPELLDFLEELHPYEPPPRSPNKGGRPSGRNFKTVSIQIEPEVWQALLDRAKQENRSAAAILRDLISRYLKRR